MFVLIPFYDPSMKQLLLFIVLTFVLASCSDKDGSFDSTDSTSIIASADTSINIASAKADDYDSGDPYTNSEIINKPGSTTLVTGTTNIYTDSLLENNSGIVLHPEEHITIEKYCGITTKNHWKEPVYKIIYKTGSDAVHGYVSQSYIACRVDTLKSQQLVTLTLDYNQSKEKFIGKICLWNRGWDLIGTSDVDLDITRDGDAPYAYFYSFSFKEIESTSLEGITESFSIGTDYGACGYVGYEYFFLWNEKKLIAFPETYSVAEAGQFHQYSYWVFPADSLEKKGSVLEIIEGDQYEDVDGETQKVNKDSTVIEYKWNKFSFLSKGDTIVKKSRTYSVTADY